MNYRPMFAYVVVGALSLGTVLTAYAAGTEPGALKNRIGFPLGAALKTTIPGGDYESTVVAEFNSMTAENAMKFGALHPEENVFNFEKADKLVEFAQRHKMRVHGHNLIWASVNPTWVKEFKGTRAQWEAMLKTHVQTIVSHFKGKVAGWDVVNEVLDDNGKFKSNVWYQNLGESFVELAFKYAQEADPAALLFMNDYSLEYGGRRLNKMFAMIADMKAKGIIVHGIGSQSHLTDDQSTTMIVNHIKKAASTGLLLHLSELEISLRNKRQKPFPLTPELNEILAQKYVAIFKAYSEIPKAQQYGITFWGVSDRDMFRNAGKSEKDISDYPMLFDYNFKPKPAYDALVRAFK